MKKITNENLDPFGKGAAMLLHRIKTIFTIHIALFILLNAYQASYVEADQQQHGLMT